MLDRSKDDKQHIKVEKIWQQEEKRNLRCCYQGYKQFYVSQHCEIIHEETFVITFYLTFCAGFAFLENLSGVQLVCNFLLIRAQQISLIPFLK